MRSKGIIQIVEASGNNYSIGFKVGSVCSDRIKSVLKHNNFSFNASILRLCKEVFPDIVSELEGMAVGAGVDFRALFSMNTGLDVGCTTIAFDNAGILLGHNEDLSENDVFLFKITHESGLRSLSLCYYGFLPGFCVSMNSEGFCQTMNGMISKSDGKIGLPNSFLLRKTIECSNINSAVNIVTSNKTLRGFHVAFYKDKIVSVESSPKRHIVNEHKVMIHTNHYLFLNDSEARNPIVNSVSRFSQAQTLINFFPRSILGIKKILSSHFDKPNSICRHGVNRTAATVLIDLSEKELYLCYGNPCKGKFKKFYL